MARKVKFVGNMEASYLTAGKEYELLKEDGSGITSVFEIIDDEGEWICESTYFSLHAGKDGQWEFVE